MEYAREQYGLTGLESEIFWEYLSHPQEIIIREGKDSQGTPVATVWENCLPLREKLNQIHPKKNKEEFDHYWLMLDIRINYLAYKKIESFYESPEYSPVHANKLISQLQTLLEEAELLDKRFIELNRSYLKSDQPQSIHVIRSEKMRSLYQRLARNK